MYVNVVLSGRELSGVLGVRARPRDFCPTLALFSAKTAWVSAGVGAVSFLPVGRREHK